MQSYRNIQIPIDNKLGSIFYKLPIMTNDSTFSTYEYELWAIVFCQVRLLLNKVCQMITPYSAHKQQDIFLASAVITRYSKSSLLVCILYLCKNMTREITITATLIRPFDNRYVQSALCIIMHNISPKS